MKNYLITGLLALGSLSINAQSDQSSVKVGDTLELGLPTSSTFNHIEMPRANFIIKRGGIANYKSLNGEKVIVTKIKNNDDGRNVHVQRQDGKKFFNTTKTVSVDLDKAITAGEIKAVK